MEISIIYVGLDVHNDYDRGSGSGSRAGQAGEVRE